MNIKKIIQFCFIFLFFYLNLLTSQSASSFINKNSTPGCIKIKDFIIYKDSSFFSAFPSVIKKHNGELIVAFRRAPERKIFGENRSFHTDPNSYLVTVSSNDNGETWTKKPELIYANPFGGSQDPCLLQLNDGIILCASYGWALLRLDNISNLQECVSVRPKGEAFLGGYLLRSSNGGKDWEGPVYPPSIHGEVRCTPMGEPLPAYNRGAMCESKDGRIFWVVAGKIGGQSAQVSTHLFISQDKGLNWEYSCPVAKDTTISFNETSVYETPKGNLVAFMRTSNFDGQACIARSMDGGKSFQPWKPMGFQGYPLQALKLPDNRVFLVYGYRYKPYGIRARILNEECTNFDTAPEIVIREDGGSTDIGYPWAVMLDEDRVLVTYYFNIDNDIRYIAGSILKIN